MLDRKVKYTPIFFIFTGSIFVTVGTFALISQGALNQFAMIGLLGFAAIAAGIVQLFEYSYVDSNGITKLPTWLHGGQINWSDVKSFSISHNIDDEWAITFKTIDRTVSISHMDGISKDLLLDELSKRGLTSHYTGECHE